MKLRHDELSKQLAVVLAEQAVRKIEQKNPPFAEHVGDSEKWKIAKSYSKILINPILINGNSSMGIK
jgi:hypothetical protein